MARATFVVDDETTRRIAQLETDVRALGDTVRGLTVPLGVDQIARRAAAVAREAAEEAISNAYRLAARVETLEREASDAEGRACCEECGRPY